MFHIALAALLSLFGLPLVAAAPIEAMGHGDAWQYGTGGGIIGFIVLIIDLIIIFEVLKSTRPVLSKVLWSLGVFFFPIIGALVYYFFSNRDAHKPGSGYEAIP